jgi:hypothetical protein
MLVEIINRQATRRGAFVSVADLIRAIETSRTGISHADLEKSVSGAVTHVLGRDAGVESGRLPVDYGTVRTCWTSVLPPPPILVPPSAM